MSYAKVLGATNRKDGYLEGNGYLVSWCVGHLVELAPPNVYDVYAEENCSFPDFSLCGVSSSDGKVAANPVQLCSCSADALHLRLRHLHCLPSDLKSIPYLAGSRIPLLCLLFRRNCHHRGHRAVQ